MKLKLSFALCCAALALHLWLGFSFIRAAAPTYDEPVHLSVGYARLMSGDCDMAAISHPPFSEMLSAAALLSYKLSAFLAHPYFTSKNYCLYGDLFLYGNLLPAGKMLGLARGFGFLVWIVLLSLSLFLFAAKLAGEGPESRRNGLAAGGFAVCVAALLPAFISNNALVTTDAASAIFYFSAFVLAYAAATAGGRRGRILYSALSGVAAGLAMGSKFSMFIVPPLVLCLWAAHAALFSKRRLLEEFLYGVIFIVAALLALAIACRLDLAGYFSALRGNMAWISGQRATFAFGRHYQEAVWWYFPAVFVFKTPLAVLLLAAAGLWRIARISRAAIFWTAVPAAIYMALAMRSGLQIGFRHLMPVMPFLALCAGFGCLVAFEKGGRWLRWAAAPLAASWIWLLLATNPYQLSYFNELAGGPENGWKYFLDSNYDWGQDLKPLAAKLKERGNPPVILNYFGVARPEYYGINYAPLPLGLAFLPLRGNGPDICAIERPLLAVSVNNVQGLYSPINTMYDWLKDRKPLFRAGYSIFVYDLDGDIEGLKRVATLYAMIGYRREAACVFGLADRSSPVTVKANHR